MQNTVTIFVVGFLGVGVGVGDGELSCLALSDIAGVEQKSHKLFVCLLLHLASLCR